MARSRAVSAYTSATVAWAAVKAPSSTVAVAPPRRMRRRASTRRQRHHESGWHVPATPPRRDVEAGALLRSNENPLRALSADETISGLRWNQESVEVLQPDHSGTKRALACGFQFRLREVVRVQCASRFARAREKPTRPRLPCHTASDHRRRARGQWPRTAGGDEEHSFGYILRQLSLARGKPVRFEQVRGDIGINVRGSPPSRCGICVRMSFTSTLSGNSRH